MEVGWIGHDKIIDFTEFGLEESRIVGLDETETLTVSRERAIEFEKLAELRLDFDKIEIVESAFVKGELKADHSAACAKVKRSELFADLKAAHALGDELREQDGVLAEMIGRRLAVFVSKKAVLGHGTADSIFPSRGPSE